MVKHIRNAVRFVEHMSPAIDYMIITNENKEIFLDIANFVAGMGMYLNLLRENSNNPDLLADEFILMLSDDKDLERKINKYYDDLRLRLEKKTIENGE